MPPRASPVDFMNAGVGLKTPGTRHELGAHGRRAIDGDAGPHHACRFAVIDAHVGNLDVAGVQITVDLAAHGRQLFTRTNNSESGSVARCAYSRGLHAGTAQEQMKQTHNGTPAPGGTTPGIGLCKGHKPGYRVWRESACEHAGSSAPWFQGTGEQCGSSAWNERSRLRVDCNFRRGRYSPHSSMKFQRPQF